MNEIAKVTIIAILVNIILATGIIWLYINIPKWNTQRKKIVEEVQVVVPEPISEECFECKKTDFKANMICFTADSYFGGLGWHRHQEWGAEWWENKEHANRVYIYLVFSGNTKIYKEVYVHAECSKVEECGCHKGWKLKEKGKAEREWKLLPIVRNTTARSAK